MTYAMRWTAEVFAIDETPDRPFALVDIYTVSDLSHEDQVRQARMMAWRDFPELETVRLEVHVTGELA